jgi:hypothetical protein
MDEFGMTREFEVPQDKLGEELRKLHCSSLNEIEVHVWRILSEERIVSFNELKEES